MPVYIKFELAGVGTIVKRVNNYNQHINDVRPAFRLIAKDFKDTERKVFGSQGSYGSRPSWKQLTPNYKIQKSLQFPGKPILQRKGTLFKSLTSNGAYNIEEITKSSVKMGSSDPKFKYHQRGTKKMVARPPITFTHYQGTKWSKIIRDYITKG